MHGSFAFYIGSFPLSGYLSHTISFRLYSRLAKSLGRLSCRTAKCTHH
uniref:Uncharacterized protein n=1 Tax=Triticum urartu TaxID=4572 RepID=A0A8R7Q8L5_TRIUA